MNFKEILELIEKVAQHGLASVEVEQAGSRVRIEGKPAMPAQVSGASASAPPMTLASAQPGTPATPSSLAQREEESEAGLHIITSPIVGTFYRSPNPETDAFANVGDRVTKGKVLCIIEAMKLMNEIESDVEGSLVTIYPQNGQPIEFGEKLFAVRV